MDNGVGIKLHEARTRKKLGLQEVEAATKIRGRYLQAIEHDEWDQLPGDIYARAFIRTYGLYLGLDGDRLAEEQRRSQGAARPGERLPRVDPKPRPVARERRRRRRRRRVSPRILGAAVTALVVAALLVVGLMTGGGSDNPGKGGQGRAHPRPHISQAVPVR